MTKTSRNSGEQLAEPLFEIDRKARDLFKPYRKSPAVEVCNTLGDVGDQAPLRTVCLGLFGLGLVRRDARMMRAGVRMLLAHELATVAKDLVKQRVDRTRPRSARSRKPAPKKGTHRAKSKTSFPSGHSAGSMAVASAFAAEYPEHRTAALATAGAVGLSRIPCCAHYPSDVAAGMAIGAAAQGAVGIVWRGVRRLLAKRGAG